MVVRERKESERQIKQNNNNQPYRSPVALWFSFSELLSGEGCTKQTGINVVRVQEPRWPYQIRGAMAFPTPNPTRTDFQQVCCWLCILLTKPFLLLLRPEVTG